MVRLWVVIYSWCYFFFQKGIHRFPKGSKIKAASKINLFLILSRRESAYKSISFLSSVNQGLNVINNRFYTIRKIKTNVVKMMAMQCNVSSISKLQEYKQLMQP